VSDLTPDDVQEILRLIDQAGYDEFELETPRFSIRFSRNADGAPKPAELAGADDLMEVTSPMVGTLYHAPGPGEPPFVKVGTRVEPGAQLCIIEVMKLMNAVTAATAGTVAEICVGNGSAVQYGEILFRIRADA
jgi:acetyl-CoA carboxylase biotin carboxyl carrier protein